MNIGTPRQYNVAYSGVDGGGCKGEGLGGRGRRPSCGVGTLCVHGVPPGDVISIPIFVNNFCL